MTQSIPLFLTLVVLGVLWALLNGALTLFNLLPHTLPIILTIRSIDVLVGATIYLKTSIDFAIFMGRLMSTNPGWKNRIAIEIGTAAGNAVGTIAIIGLWVFLKNIDILLALMVLIASLVLFELAHSSLEHFSGWKAAMILHKILDPVKRLTDPILSRIVPDLGTLTRGSQSLPWKKLLTFSMTVPFILGLDDFAGYVPLFNIVNVYGFALGVLGAHTLLNIALFFSPNRTIALVKNEFVSFLGTLAFIGLGLYGLLEAFRIIFRFL